MEYITNTLDSYKISMKQKPCKMITNSYNAGWKRKRVYRRHACYIQYNYLEWPTGVMIATIWQTSHSGESKIHDMNNRN